MLDPQPTATEPSCQEPFRWPHADILDALEQFSSPDPPSQRAFARQFGVPPATFNYWQRHYSPETDNPVDAFFRSAAGTLVLRRILCAVLVVFQQRGACGLRLVSAFLELTQLDRFVASSRSALQSLATHLEADLVAFRDEHQPLLAAQMPHKTISVTSDEHFHSVKNCLVAIEPVTDFVLVEDYHDHRDADTWTQALTEGTAGMDLHIVALTSDLARGLLCCAEKGLQVMHSPDLFHGQRDLLQPLLLPLQRPIQQAEKDLEKAHAHSVRLDTPLEQPQSEEELRTLIEVVRHEVLLGERLQQARQRKDEAVQQVRGVGDDYHPFDRQTGKPLTAQEVGQRLQQHLDQLQQVVQEAGLGDKATQALNKSRTWVEVLMGVVAWFWNLAESRVAEWDLSEEQEQIVYEKLLPGHYWSLAAGRARTSLERQRLAEMAQRLQQEAWQAEALSTLTQEKRKEVEALTRETVGLFQRSSSCVEGRNGRLSLQHHGHSRVSERRLKALTVIHNYLVKRPDGTTAAQRFFGQTHPDLFSWLLQRMPDLPRPAQKRRKPAA